MGPLEPTPQPGQLPNQCSGKLTVVALETVEGETFRRFFRRNITVEASSSALRPVSSHSWR